MNANYALELTVVENYSINNLQFSLSMAKGSLTPLMTLELHLNEETLSSLSYDFKTKKLSTQNMQSIKKEIRLGDTDISFEVDLQDLAAFPKANA